MLNYKPLGVFAEKLGRKEQENIPAILKITGNRIRMKRYNNSPDPTKKRKRCGRCKIQRNCYLAFFCPFEKYSNKLRAVFCMKMQKRLAAIAKVRNSVYIPMVYASTLQDFEIYS